jgi:heptose-I-phosphate ethanolaminephosphotransferase
MRKIDYRIRALEQYFPRYLVMLVLAPILAGYLIDHELIHPISILVNILWVLPFTLPFRVFRKKFIYRIGVVVYFFIGFIEIAHWLLIKGPLTITSLLIFFSTNIEEALDFLTLKSTLALLVLIPYTLLFSKAFRDPPEHDRSAQAYIPYKMGIALLIPGLIMLSLLGSIPKIRLVPQAAKVMYAITIDLGKYNRAIAENNLREVEATVVSDSRQQTFVLIIGESCSRNHMSLYGAPSVTNPKLGKRKDIYAFNNVVSPYSYTTLSVPSILSESNLENKLSFAESVDLLDIFHSAGFKTYWISNQSPIGLWDNIISSIARKADYSNFVNISSNSSQETILNRSYDSRLFEPFQKVLNEKVDKKFIVLHLMGNHNTYSKRYPKSFDHFKGKGSRGRLKAEYLNSVLYNDHIVDSLLNSIQLDASRKKSLTMAIYTSDHGENLYDEQERVGHDYSNVMPKANVEIPFVVWLSDKFIDSQPDKAAIVETNKEIPFVSDDLFHCIMDLNGIQSPYLHKARSIFNEGYDDTRRRILVDGNDYDSK